MPLNGKDRTTAPSFVPDVQPPSPRRRALIGPDYGESSSQALPGSQKAAGYSDLRDRLDQATLRHQPGASNPLVRKYNAAVHPPVKIARNGGVEAQSAKAILGEVGWKHVIATAVSPALLPPSKGRKATPDKLLQSPQAEPASSAKFPAKLAGAPKSDTPAAREADSATRTIELIESLKPDTRGDEVKELQRRLGLEQQGTYGPKTLAAVKQHVLGKEFSRINTELGTRIDFNALLGYEGFSLQGYVPAVEGSKSGVTVGVGFDIGQFSEADIKAFRFSDDLTKKLLPYAGLKLADATTKLEEVGGLTVSVGEVQEIAYAVKKKFARDVSAKYDKSRAEGVPKFAELTPAQQTVIFSRFFHQGLDFTDYTNAASWWGGVTAGKWADVQSILRNYPFAKKDWYKARVGKEADSLGDLSAETEKK